MKFVNITLYSPTQIAYSPTPMKAIFKEMSLFASRRVDYLSDEEFRLLQTELMENPMAGTLIQGTGGLRKMRIPAPSRGKGKRGGFRVIYYWYVEGMQFWLFTIYGKHEMNDLTTGQKAMLKEMLKAELAAQATQEEEE